MNRRVSQPDAVLNYLNKKESINSIEAFGLYGITRLAAVVYRLRSRGINIVSRERQGIRSRYTEYHLGPRTDSV